MKLRVGWLLLALAVAGAFAGLGTWQWGRAQVKLERIAAFEAARTAPAQALAAVVVRGGTSTVQRVRASGTLDAAQRFHLDNQVRDGRAGVHVFVPLRLDGANAIVLVDLGWLVLMPNRIVPEPPPLPARLDSEGWLAPPPAAGLKLGSALPGPEGARLVNYIDTAALAQRFGDTLVRDAVLYPDPDPASGLVREFRPAPGLPPERHRGYALQWYGLALAVMVIYLVLTFRRR